MIGTLNRPSLMSVFIPVPVGLAPLPMPPNTPLEGVVLYGVEVVGVVLDGLVVEGVVVDGFVVTGVVVMLVPAALKKAKQESRNNLRIQKFHNLANCIFSVFNSLKC